MHVFDNMFPGNGFFALTQHAIPQRWKKMAIVTSAFHMPRSQAIFEWVFGLQGAGTSLQDGNEPTNGSLVPPAGSRSQGFILQYHSVSDDGIDRSIIEVRFALFQLLLWIFIKLRHMKCCLGCGCHLIELNFNFPFLDLIRTSTICKFRCWKLLIRYVLSKSRHKFLCLSHPLGCVCRLESLRKGGHWRVWRLSPLVSTRSATSMYGSTASILATMCEIRGCLGSKRWMILLFGHIKNHYLLIFVTSIVSEWGEN